MLVATCHLADGSSINETLMSAQHRVNVHKKRLHRWLALCPLCECSILREGKFSSLRIRLRRRWRSFLPPPSYPWGQAVLKYRHTFVEKPVTLKQSYQQVIRLQLISEWKPFSLVRQHSIVYRFLCYIVMLSCITFCEMFYHVHPPILFLPL